MGPADLAQVLSALPPITDPAVLVGTSTADDAAVYRISDELALIQTVDFFTPIVDSAYWFGAISAANSISDVYAMGGRPVLALNVVGFPSARDGVPLSTLGDILRGGADKASEAGISIVGGHTVDDNEPKYGLSVTGLVHPDRIWRNVGGAPGDRLVLTKPLGTGIVSTAVRAGAADEATTRATRDAMATLNRAAAEVAHRFTVRACTDITGFGLLGHLREMLSGAATGARVRASAVPLLPGAAALAADGYVPGGSRRNLRALAEVAAFAADVPETARLLLCDAQTSGGLLFAVPDADAAAFVTALHDAGVPAADIGQLTGSGQIEVRL